jgi:purine-binding chemotaxis protein CheW
MIQPTSYRYSILEICGYHVGVEVFSVQEVLTYPRITAIPNVHPSIKGVFNLRGQIYSLIDIAELFMLKKEKTKAENYVVILEYEDISFGILVNKVMDVLTIESDKIEIPSGEDPLQLIQYSNGVVNHEGLGDIYLLDMPVLINAKEINQYRF